MVCLIATAATWKRDISITITSRLICILVVLIVLIYLFSCEFLTNNSMCIDRNITATVIGVTAFTGINSGWILVQLTENIRKNKVNVMSVI